MRKLFYIFSFVLIIFIGFVVLAGESHEICAEKATGAGRDTNRQIYWVDTGIAGENEIGCSKEQLWMMV